jgi:hypothetical protein
VITRGVKRKKAAAFPAAARGRAHIYRRENGVCRVLDPSRQWSVRAHTHRQIYHDSSVFFEDFLNNLLRSVLLEEILSVCPNPAQIEYIHFRRALSQTIPVWDDIG